MGTAENNNKTSKETTRIEAFSDDVFASLLSVTIFIVSFLSIWIAMILFGFMFLIFIFPKTIVTRLKKK